MSKMFIPIISCPEQGVISSAGRDYAGFSRREDAVECLPFGEGHPYEVLEVPVRLTVYQVVTWYTTGICGVEVFEDENQNIFLRREDAEAFIVEKSKRFGREPHEKIVEIQLK